MIDIQHSNERNFCGAITPKEKDKIMKAILDMAAHERKTFCFTPNDVPNLKINGKQFEMVIMDFFEKGYIIKENISQYNSLNLACRTTNSPSHWFEYSSMSVEIHFLSVREN